MDDRKYGFCLSFLKKVKDFAKKKEKRRRHLYISVQCDKPVKRVLGSCQKCRLKRKTACPNSLHKKTLLL